MAVLKPVKVTLTNYPEGVSEELDFEINPADKSGRTRKITFSRDIYIDADDFSLDPPPKYFRLKKGGYVRLKSAYIIRCDEVVFGKDGQVEELICTYVPESRSGADTSGIKVKGVIQWVNAKTAVDTEIRKYGYLLKDEQYPGQDFSERMNENSEQIVQGKAEPALAAAEDGTPFQLLRTGYYKKCTEGEKLVLSEIVSLKDNFNKK